MIDKFPKIGSITLSICRRSVKPKLAIVKNLPSQIEERRKYIEDNSIGDVESYKPKFPEEYYVVRGRRK